MCQVNLSAGEACEVVILTALQCLYWHYLEGLSVGVLLTIKSLIQGAPNPKAKMYLNRLADVVAQSIKARC